jgi:hypothetical protein
MVIIEDMYEKSYIIGQSKLAIFLKIGKKALDNLCIIMHIITYVAHRVYKGI